MAKKTFKIGEYANGGIITAEVKKTSIVVVNKEWDFSTGSRRSSNQSNAQELSTKVFNFGDDKPRWSVWVGIEMYLGELTTAYYAGKIVEWMKSQIK